MRLAIQSPADAAEAALEEVLAEVRDGDESRGPVTGVMDAAGATAKPKAKAKKG